MSFPRYSKYKASGVEWLGDVPEHWEVKPLRNVFKFSKGLTITKEDLRDEGVGCVNYGEIHSKFGFCLNPNVDPLRCVDPEFLSSNPDALIRDGDFVFADTSEDLEGSGNFTHLSSEKPIFAGYHTIIARPEAGICSLLLAYQFHSLLFRSQIQRQVKGVKVFSISQGILKSAKCWLPPLAEQTAIAVFLDQETAKIDALVAEQRRLIELLKEKRQAVISHAVTKGLNPNAKMKPSGVEWLGDVPEHWEVKRLRFVAELNPSKSEVATLARETVVSFLPMESIGNDGTLILDKEKTIGELETGYTYFRDGDVTIAKITPCYENGKGGLMRGLKNGIGFGTTELIVARPKAFQSIGSYLHYLFISQVFRDIGESHMYGAGGQKRVPDAFVRNFTMAIPPLAEQTTIAAFLDRETARFDTLTAEAHQAIDLLQERRTALISAAVTGQIDVRQKATKETA